MIKKLYLFDIQHIIDIFDITSYKILYLISSYNFSQLRSNVLFVTNFLIWNDLHNYHITNPLFFSYQNVRLLFFFVPSLSPEEKNPSTLFWEVIFYAWKTYTID